MLTELSTTFLKILQWHPKRVEFLTYFIISLLKVKILNLSEISEGFPNNLDENSNYRRIQRFFSEFNFIFTTIAKLFLSFIPGEKYIISIDRTRWKNINLLFLLVNFNGIGIPILWESLDKKGNTNIKERIDLLSDFINLFGVDRIEVLLADREFIGKDWFKWLKHKNIPFMIRIRDNILIKTLNGNKSKVKNYFHYYLEKEI